MAAVVTALSAAKDLATLRAAFAAVSAAMADVVAHFGHAESHPAFLFRCTEESLKAPGEWLQEVSAGRSPYSGRSDPECAKPVKVCGATATPAAP